MPDHDMASSLMTPVLCRACQQLKQQQQPSHASVYYFARE